jgi:hypothetical protein
VQRFGQHFREANIGELATGCQHAVDPSLEEQLIDCVCELHEQVVVRCSPVRFAERVLQPEAAVLLDIITFFDSRPPTSCYGNFGGLFGLGD